MNTKKLEAKLDEAERLIEDGWANESDKPLIYRHGESGSEREIDPIVWIFMRAVSRGIGMKSSWDRERAKGG